MRCHSIIIEVFSSFPFPETILQDISHPSHWAGNQPDVGLRKLGNEFSAGFEPIAFRTVSSHINGRVEFFLISPGIPSVNGVSAPVDGGFLFTFIKDPRANIELALTNSLS